MPAVKKYSVKVKAKMSADVNVSMSAKKENGEEAKSVKPISADLQDGIKNHILDFTPIPDVSNYLINFKNGNMNFGEEIVTYGETNESWMQKYYLTWEQLDSESGIENKESCGYVVRDQGKFNAPCIAIKGTASEKYVIPDQDISYLGHDLTVEFWFRFARTSKCSADSAANRFSVLIGNGSGTDGFCVENEEGKCSYYIPSSDEWFHYCEFTLDPYAWNHYAAVVKSGKMNVFFNGKKLNFLNADTDEPSQPTVSSGFSSGTFGGITTDSLGVPLLISDMRIIENRAVYTENFAVPTQGYKLVTE